MYLDGYPLDIAIQRWLADVNGNHEPLDRTIIEWFSDGVIVEITTRQLGNENVDGHTVFQQIP